MFIPQNFRPSALSSYLCNIHEKVSKIEFLPTCVEKGVIRAYLCSIHQKRKKYVKLNFCVLALKNSVIKQGGGCTGNLQFYPRLWESEWCRVESRAPSWMRTPPSHPTWRGSPSNRTAEIAPRRHRLELQIGRRKRRPSRYKHLEEMWGKGCKKNILLASAQNPRLLPLMIERYSTKANFWWGESFIRTTHLLSAPLWPATVPWNGLSDDKLTTLWDRGRCRGVLILGIHATYESTGDSNGSGLARFG